MGDGLQSGPGPYSDSLRKYSGPSRGQPFELNDLLKLFPLPFDLRGRFYGPYVGEPARFVLRVLHLRPAGGEVFRLGRAPRMWHSALATMRLAILEAPLPLE